MLLTLLLVLDRWRGSVLAFNTALGSGKERPCPAFQIESVGAICHAGRHNFAQADEITLRYKAFLGDQIFVVNEADFSARWEWVPLLDFAACLYAIVEKLKCGQKELVFEFTESDAQIQFNGQGGEVLIASNYSNAKSIVLLSELDAAVYSHARQVLLDATDHCPGLQANSSFRTWYPPVLSLEGGGARTAPQN